MPNLDLYLDKKVAELVAQPTVAIAPEEAERHRIYSLLVMAITEYCWNGNKDGRSADYPLNPLASNYPTARFLGGDYLGHNIAAILVDKRGNVLDFDFNHNEIFNSSAEHAEARLVRRVFALSQLNTAFQLHSGNPARNSRYSNILNDVTLYTSLESCAQCSGIMALALLKQVVYLQLDPGQYHVGNILRRLTEDPSGQSKQSAPLPVPGDLIEFPYYSYLNEAYEAFRAQQKTKEGLPFSVRGDQKRYTESITSFLCTDAAFQIYRQAAVEFDALTSAGLTYSDYRPTEDSLTNADCIDEARQFLHYARELGFRATPHR